MLIYMVNMAVGVQPSPRQAAAYLEAPEVAKLPTSLAAGSLVLGEAWELMGLHWLGSASVYLHIICIKLSTWLSLASAVGRENWDKFFLFVCFLIWDKFVGEADGPERRRCHLQ